MVPGAPNPAAKLGTISRLVRLAGRGSTAQPPTLEPLLRTVRAQNPKADIDLLARAYAVAERCHEGQKRKSGDPYITHPVAVATILAEMGMTGAILAAALLHDTVEDTEYSLEQLTKEFGEEIAKLVDGVTKLDKVQFGEAAQAETVRKMVIAMSKDIRVLLIKLADRLHNARTWRYVSPESSAKKARETLEIFAPLARALRKNNLPLQKLMTHDVLSAVAQELRHQDISALYAAVGDGHTSAQNVIEHLSAMVGGKDGTVAEVLEETPIFDAPVRASNADAGVIVPGAGEVLAKLARCCTSVPPDRRCVGGIPHLWGQPPFMGSAALFGPWRTVPVSMGLRRCLTKKLRPCRNRTPTCVEPGRRKQRYELWLGIGLYQRTG